MPDLQGCGLRGYPPLFPRPRRLALRSYSPSREVLRWKGQGLERRRAPGGREPLESPTDPGPVLGPLLLDPQRHVARGARHPGRGLQNLPAEVLPAPELSPSSLDQNASRMHQVGRRGISTVPMENACAMA